MYLIFKTHMQNLHSQGIVLVPINNIYLLQLLYAFPALFSLNNKTIIFDKIWRCDCLLSIMCDIIYYDLNLKLSFLTSEQLICFSILYNYGNTFLYIYYE